MTSILFSFASLFLVLSPCMAQPPQETQEPAPKLRSRLIGRTALADGTVWADCEISFFSRPISDFVDFGESDLVKVSSSSKGRFHAKLLPGRSYMAWAHSVDDKGRHWFGQAVERAVAGEVVKFVRAKVPVAGEKLIINGREPWKAHAPFSFHLRFGSQNMEIPLGAVDAKGNLGIPPIAWKNALILAKTAAGEPLFVFNFKRATLPILPKAWKLAAPQPLPLHIQDENGPVKGARVSALVFKKSYRSPPSSRGRPSVSSIVRQPGLALWAELGVSDANGNCDLLAHKANGTYRSLTLRIEADGMADEVFVIQKFPLPKVPMGAAPGQEEEKVTPGPARIEIVLEKGVEIHGRILWAKDKPAANFPFVVLRKAQHKKKRGQSSKVIMPYEVYRTSKQGGFSFSFLRAKTLYRIVTPLDENLWSQLSSSYKGLRLPSPYLLLHQARSSQEAKLDLGDLSLDKMVAVDLDLEGARRDRQANSVVILKNVTEKASVVSEAISILNFAFDAQGRACFLLPPGSYDSLILHPKRGTNQESFHFEERDRGKIFEREVQLEPYHTILVTVTDGQSKPIEGVKLSTSGGGYSHISKLCSEIYAFNGRAISGSVTDEEGTARIHLIAVKSQNYNCQATDPKNSGNRSSRVKIDTNNLPETLDLELSR